MGKATGASAMAGQWRMLLLVGLSLSIGWGIRGNFGHEWGAALPGALAAMAAVLLSGREDWLRRVAWFAMFGAIGWSFGGSMAYMVVIAFTHSGDSASVLYGFFCLCIIGFLWGTIGGAGTALPAFLSRERLTEFIVPLTTIFLAWWADSILEGRFIDSNPILSKQDPLYWFDSNWLSALLAILVVLIRAAFRRRLDTAERLILAMAIGWWVGFLLLTIGLHLHMIPNHSDNWAGSIGMVIAMWLVLRRRGLNGVILASLTTGFIGGLGFASAQLLKLIEIKSGLATNWHSILEQTYGLINGLGVAVAMAALCRRAPRVTDDPPPHRWVEAFAISFVLLLLTYLNLYKEVNDWIGAKAIPATMYFLTTHGWFDLFYALLALTFLRLLREHLRRPLPIVPPTWLGKGQMLYLALLWWMVIGNFLKAIVGFAPQRLVTEGVILVNALVCTLMALLWAREASPPQVEPTPDYIAVTDYSPMIKKAIVTGVAVLTLVSFVDWGIIRAIYGNTFAGYAGLHIRFGPHATANRH